MEGDQWEQFLPKMLDEMPTLSVLDDRCRCSICKDYLHGPMMTLCGHTFCSLCIRRALNSEGRCPSCRSLEEESKLRKNLMIEEIVEAFRSFRTSLMRFAADRELVSQKGSTTPEAQVNENSIVECSDDDAIVPSHPVANTSRTSRVTRASTLRSSQEHANPVGLQRGHIACPVCQRIIHQDKAETHVNRCLEGKATPPSSPVLPEGTSDGVQSHYFEDSSRCRTPMMNRINATKTNGAQGSSTTSIMKRLPKMSYAAMSDAKLRKTMAEMGISTIGSRAQLQRRCTEFIAMWNSNLDSKNPKSKKDLLNDMKAWDRVQARPVTKITNEEIDNAHENGRYDDNFGDLILKARESLKKRKATEIEDASKGNGDVNEAERHHEKRQSVQDSELT